MRLWSVNNRIFLKTKQKIMTIEPFTAKAPYSGTRRSRDVAWRSGTVNVAQEAPNALEKVPRKSPRTESPAAPSKSTRGRDTCHFFLISKTLTQSGSNFSLYPFTFKLCGFSFLSSLFLLSALKKNNPHPRHLPGCGKGKQKPRAK